MHQILELSFSAANMIATILFVFVILYWLSVLIGAVDMSSLDFDLDLDADVDVDLDVDVDAETHGSPDVHSDFDGNPEADLGWMNKLLLFFNLGKVPFMVWMSFVALFTWIACIAITGTLGISNFLLGLVVFVPSLLGSMFISKFTTMPFVPLFKALDDTKLDTNPVGKICKISLPIKDGKVGQAEVNIEGNHQRIYVTAKPGVELALDDTALVIQFDESQNNYLIEPYKHS